MKEIFLDVSKILKPDFIVVRLLEDRKVVNDEQNQKYLWHIIFFLNRTAFFLYNLSKISSHSCFQLTLH